MELLPGLPAFLTLFFGVAAVGVALLAIGGGAFLLRNRARRLRLRLPVVTYYRQHLLPS